MYPFFISLVLSLFLAHDLHLSSTTIHIRTDKSRIEIATHLFLDDVELALKNISDEELKLCTPYEAPIADSLLMDYIKNHLQISIEGKKQALRVVGKEPSEDFQAVWVYLAIEDVETEKGISIHCDYLHEVYDDQKNLVNVKKNRAKLKTSLLDAQTHGIEIPQ